MAVKNVKFVLVDSVARMKVGQAGYVSSSQVIIGAPGKDDNGMPVVYIKKSAFVSPRKIIHMPSEESRLKAVPLVSKFDVGIKRLSKVGWELDFADATINFKAVYTLSRETRKQLIAVGRLDMSNPDINPAMREKIER